MAVKRYNSSTSQWEVYAGYTPTASNVTIGTTTILLGGTSTTIAGLTSASSNIFNSASYQGLGTTTASFYGEAGPGTLNTGSSGLGYMGMPQVTVGTASTTLDATHAGKHFYIDTASRFVVIPANGTLNLPIGYTVAIINNAVISSSVAVVAGSTDVLKLANSTLTGTRSLASNSFATLVKISTASWIISGAGVS